MRRGREGRGRQATGRAWAALATGGSGCWGLATACLWAARSAEEGRWEKPCPLAGAHSNSTIHPHLHRGHDESWERQLAGALRDPSAPAHDSTQTATTSATMVTGRHHSSGPIPGCRTLLQALMFRGWQRCSSGGLHPPHPQLSLLTWHGLGTSVAQLPALPAFCHLPTHCAETAPLGLDSSKLEAHGRRCSMDHVPTLQFPHSRHGLK